MLSRVDDVRDVIKQNNEQNAKLELQQNIDNLLTDINRILEELTSWDEVYQQLDVATYYVYWRDNRLPNLGKFPSYVETIELYNADGQSLSQLKYASFPFRAPETPAYIQKENNQLFLFVFNKIKPQTENQVSPGYIGIKVDFEKGFKALSKFTHIVPASVSLNPIKEEKLHTYEILKYFIYQPRTNPYTQALYSVIESRLNTFFALLASILAIIFFIVSISISRPLRYMEKHISALRLGNKEPEKDQPLSLKIKEIETLKSSLDDYQHTLDKAYDKLDRQNVELWSMAHKDALTGVYNRRAFDDDWHSLTDVVKHQRVNITYMLFDCNHFKSINDSYGHDVGDQVIQIIAEILQSALRKGDKLYRLGGDEFAAVLVNNDPEKIDHITQRCMNLIADYPFHHFNINEPVSISIGFAHSIGTDFMRLNELPKFADIAMYQAKASYDKVVQFTDEMLQNNIALTSTRIVSSVLHTAKTADNLEMHYQPVFKTWSSIIDYYECLVRIRDKEDIIFPGDIFPIIQRHSLEAEFDLAIIKHITCRLNKNLIPADVGLSINLSAAAIVLPDLLSQLEPLHKYTQRRKIILEVTETDMITHLQRATENLEQLRNIGFHIALDDFGSGYSSIRYLANMPIDIVKFDISMIQDINKDPRTYSIIKNTAKMILDAGYKLVAEGIEDEQAAEQFKAMGVTHLQGYYYGRPAPLSKIAEVWQQAE